jgi:hypothetical protein
MRTDDDWNGSQPGFAPGGAIRIALIFGSIAVALGLVIAPLFEQRIMHKAGTDGLDFMSTGSVGANSGYTIRRSVLQATRDSVCIIHTNGARSGDCD